MNRYMMVGLFMLAGAALGGGAIQTLHTQAKPHGYVTLFLRPGSTDVT